MKAFKRKGITIMELIISLALMTIVFLILMPFFFNNNRTLNTTYIKSELQSEGENIISYMSKRFMECKSIEEVDKDEEGNIRTIKLKLYDGQTICNFSLESEILTCEITEGDKNSKLKIGQDIGAIKIDITKDNMKEAKVIEIEIKLRNKDVKYSIKDKIFFRNRE